MVQGQQQDEGYQRHNQGAQAFGNQHPHAQRLLAARSAAGLRDEGPALPRRDSTRKRRNSPHDGGGHLANGNFPSRGIQTLTFRAVRIAGARAKGNAHPQEQAYSACAEGEGRKRQAHDPIHHGAAPHIPRCQQEGEHREEGQQKCDPGPQNCVRDAAPSPGVTTAARGSGATSATQQAGGALRKPSRPELAPVLQEPRQDHNEAQEATPDRQGPQVNADPMPGRQVKVHPSVLVRGVDNVPLQLVMQVDRVVGDGAQKYAVPKSGHDNEHARVLGQHKLATLLRSD
mmetsp:Transcript_59306/g.170331  ORF Transcript_59306/g.170331 Transcript_59306/m.170331 type:complete len:287 (-) Transcript_59306:622-1482(-)